MRALILLLVLLLGAPAQAADSTVAAMTAASALDGTELYYCVQGGADRKCTGAQIKTWTSASPTLVTPVLGVATATSINKMAITAPATSSTLAVADGKTATVSNTLTFTGTDGSTVAFGAGGTVGAVGYSATPLGVALGGTGLTGGTSGGIPYYSGAATIASSAALTANLPVIGGGAGVAPSVGTRSGNTTAFVTTTGAQTSGDCVKIDASGNHIANGSACGSGGGGLTVGTSTITSGTTLRLLYDNAGVLGETAGVTFSGTGQLTLAAGTITTSQPAISATQTWNAGGVTFSGITINITNTASAAASKLFDVQVGGSSVLKQDTSGSLTIVGLNAGPSVGDQFKIDGSGAGTSVFANFWVIGDARTYQIGVGNSTASLSVPNKFFIYDRTGSAMKFTLDGATNIISLPPTMFIAWSSTVAGAANDVALIRDGAVGVLAQQVGTTAQTLRVYNTFTDASNYERGVFDWTTTANVLAIGTEKAGTGATRNLKFLVGGTTQLDYGVTNAGNWTLNVPIVLKGYTVGTLPTGVTGANAYVTDAVACTFLATLTGGGSTFCPVIFNGTAWVGA